MGHFNTPGYCSLKEAYNTTFRGEEINTSTVEHSRTTNAYDKHAYNHVHTNDEYKITNANAETDVETKVVLENGITCSNFISHYKSCPECLEMMKEYSRTSIGSSIEHFGRNLSTRQVNDIILWAALLVLLWILFFK